MSKALVCTCEDVTLDDVRHAVSKGHRDIESVKRYTGFGTGFCQGKSCVSQVGALLAEADRDRVGAAPFTPRPPTIPTPLAVWASAPFNEAREPGDGTPPLEDRPKPPTTQRAPLPARAEVVIVGGGIMGLALAHALSRQGLSDVLVLEESYLCAGASGRNGGGVRMQWGTRQNIELAKRSIYLMKRFARETGVNIWLRQGGYVFLAKTHAVAARLEKNTELHHSLGVRTRLLTADEARDLVPGLTLRGIQACAYNPDDGVIFPWPFLWGYAQAARTRGVRIETFTRVTGFEIAGGLIRKVRTERGDVACGRVVLAAGAWSPAIAQLAGVELPNRPYRHEILSTEPLKPFLNPLVSVLDTGLYFSQSMRGEIVGGMGDSKEPPALNMGSTLRFLGRFSRALLEQMPHLGPIKVLRQWAGCYDVTPDNNPILGETPGLSNLLQMSGFVGHGFMMAPAVAERMAAWMVTSQSDELFSRYNLARFAEGKLEPEQMIIG